MIFMYVKRYVSKQLPKTDEKTYLKEGLKCHEKYHR